MALYGTVPPFEDPEFPLISALRKLHHPKAERKQPAPKLETCFLQVIMYGLHNATMTDCT